MIYLFHFSLFNALIFVSGNRLIKPITFGERSSHYAPFVRVIITKEVLPNGTILNSLCGGSFLTSKIVLTAAHCVLNNNETARIPSGGIFVEWGSYIEHSQPYSSTVCESHFIYGSETGIYKGFHYDIAALILTDEATRGMEPIFLPSRPLTVGQSVTAYGFGVDENGDNSGFLKKVTIPVADEDYCEDFLVESEIFGLDLPHSIATFAMGCAISNNYIGGADQGDSGGPVTSGDTRVQYGVVSMSLNDAPGRYHTSFVLLYDPFVRHWLERLLMYVN